MHIDPPEAGPRQLVFVDESQHFVVVDLGRLGKRPEKSQHLGTTLQVSTSELADHELMAPDLALLQRGDQAAIPSAQVLDPDGCVDQHSARPPRPTTRNEAQAGLSASQRSQATRALAGDQGFETRMHDRGFLLQAAEPLRLAQQRVVHVQCGSHMHQYA